jgi:hypothetical protein
VQEQNARLRRDGELHLVRQRQPAAALELPEALSIVVPQRLNSGSRTLRTTTGLVRVVVRQGTETLEKIDPAVEVSDLIKIRDWFDCLANDRLPRFSRLSFIEPCLAFAYLANTDVGTPFEIVLDAELAPPFPLRQFSEPIDEWHIVFELERGRLAAVVAEVD